MRRAFFASVLFAARAFADDCVEPQGNEGAWHTRLTIDDSRPREVVIPAARGSWTLLSVEERSVDVQVTHWRAGRVSTFDHAVPRQAVQFLLLHNGKDERSVQVRSRDFRAQGEVVVRSHPGHTLSRRCLDLIAALADGDALYAQWLQRRDVQFARRALNRYDAAAVLAERAGSQRFAARATLAGAAVSYHALDRWSDAADRAEQAARKWDDLGDSYWVARSRAYSAASWIELVNRGAPGLRAPDRGVVRSLAEARQVLLELEAFHAARGESFEQARQLNNLGLAYFYDGDFPAAIAAYERSLPLYRRLRETEREAQVLQNIALTEWGLGLNQQALARFDAALALGSEKDSPAHRPILLNNSALAHFSIADHDTALRLHSEALRLSRSSGTPRITAQSLYGLGVVWASLGDTSLANTFLEQSLELRRAETDVRGRFASLRALAALRHQSGNHAASAALAAEALEFATTPVARQRLWVHLAADRAHLEGADVGLSALDRAALEVPLDPFTRALALLERGRMLARLSRLDEARAALVQSAQILRSEHSARGEFDALLELARVERMADRDGAALTTITAALELAEVVRVQSANPAFRSGLLRPLRAAFELRIDLLAKRHRALLAQGRRDEATIVARDALSTAELARSRGWIDFRNTRFLTDSTTGDDERYRRLLRDVAARQFHLDTIREQDPADVARILALSREVAALRHELEMLHWNTTSTLTAVPTRRGRPPATAAIPQHARVIEYWLGSDASYAWVVDSREVRMFDLGPTAPIARAITEFDSALRGFQTVDVAPRIEAASDLFERILRPVESATAGARALYVAADGDLHRVPFAALRDSKRDRYVVEHVDVASIPGLWALTPPDRSKAVPNGARVLVVADPQYESPVGPRASELSAEWFTPRGDPSRTRLRPLPATRREAERVASFYDASRLDLLLGPAASRAGLQRLDLSAYRIIHVAAHAFVDPVLPRASAIALSAFDKAGRPIDPWVWARDLEQRRFNAELIVFSACESAGGSQVAGEGLDGLQYVALARGADAVTATLWSVPDEIAADVATELHRHVAQNHVTAVGALGATLRGVARRAATRDPGLWGAWVVSVASIR